MGNEKEIKGGFNENNIKNTWVQPGARRLWGWAGQLSPHGHWGPGALDAQQLLGMALALMLAAVARGETRVWRRRVEGLRRLGC